VKHREHRRVEIALHGGKGFCSVNTTSSYNNWRETVVIGTDGLGQKPVPGRSARHLMWSHDTWSTCSNKRYALMRRRDTLVIGCYIVEHLVCSRNAHAIY